MALGTAFWILMLFWLIGYGVAWSAAPQPWLSRVPTLLLFVIIGILGWHAFGAPIHGG